MREARPAPKHKASPVAAPMASRAKRRGARVAVLGVLLTAFIGKIVHRAYEIQVVDPEAYERHYREEIEVEAKRGNIYDRRGAALAVSVEQDSFFADPVMLQKRANPAEVAAKLGPIFGIDTLELTKKLASSRRFVWIRRRASPAQTSAALALGLDRSYFGSRKEPRRYYPNREGLAHVLGFTDDQGRGVEGLERAFDTRLRGAVDKVSAIIDARGGVVFSEELLDRESAQGQSLVLTIDREIQVATERELELGVRAVEGRAGSVVVMDPNSGEILALANYPTFNPNEPGAAEAAARRNRAVTDRFEPGSVIKVFTVAGALSQGVISPNQQIDCEGGAMRVAEYTIHDSHHWESLTPAEILAYSSNIGTAKIGEALGRAELFRTLRRFGFGARTEVELPAEAEGILRHYRRWYEMDAATIAFGQGMSVTSMQLATAMAAVANGGRLVKPMLVSRILDVNGGVIEERAPTIRRQVLPAQVARQTADMLTKVTEPGGTGEAAAMDGYLVAGKTGTAQKADYTKGGYAAEHWTATFVGFVPAQKPRLVISVVIDEPLIEHYGGIVAGPVFRRVAEHALRQLGVPPEQGGGRLAELIKKKNERERASESTPKAPSEATAPALAPSAMEAQGELPSDRARVPDLTGRGARAALVALRAAELSGATLGSGVVRRQLPAPGMVVAKGASVTVWLSAKDDAATLPAEPAAPVAVPAAAQASGVVPAQGQLASVDVGRAP